VIQDVDNLLNNCQSEQVASKELKTILAFLAAKIVYTKGHRLGVVQNMTINEFEEAREEDDDTVIIIVRKHKTASSLGPISAVVSRADYQRMKLFKDRIRSRIIPQCRIVLSLFSYIHRK